MAKESKLLQPIQVGNLTLKNRIMFPPLTTGYEQRDGSIGPRSFSFYQRLAKGGAAYVVIGDVAPVNTASPTPKLFDDRQIPTFKKLADAMHEYDCKLALQLFHPEYDVPGVGKMIMQARMAGMEAQKLKAAGDMEAFSKKMEESQKLTKDAYAKLHHDMKFFVSECSHEQLNQIKEAIAASAKRAQQAGVDAIEVHGDRLLGSLCSTLLNHRNDEYGGSLENRVRYALEVVQAIKEAAPEMMIEYKLPIVTVNEDGSYRGKGGLIEEEALIFAQLLEKAGVDMIQVAQANHTGNMGDTIPPMGSIAYNWTLPIARKVKELVSIPVSTVGRVISVEAGEKILEDGDADIISYGRSLLTDPDIALKIERNEPIRECLNCNKGCVDAIQNRKYISCVLNAENGDEETIFIKPNETPKNICIIGGGIAGCEAARVCAKRNHKVTLFEASNRLGGQINLAAIPPRKMEILRSIKYYEKILPDMVDIQYNTKPSVETINSFDEVIVAIGAQDFMLNIEGNTSNVVSSWDVLNGKVDVQGKVAVIGGGLVGTETAEYLAQKGCDVSIIEMTDKIAAQESGTILPLIQKDFKEHNVKEYVNTKVCGISEDGKTILANNPDPVQIPCDVIVMAVGSKKNNFDTTGIQIPIHFAGDCAGERTADIASAIRSAYHCANEI
ncbi:bilirubin reductase, long form [Floccifex sp.]|uniref:bilirubin reductase, long form n=1 Tax=Floccifex sp. TaxID=2815810 RepID=UPI003F08BDF6